MQRSENLSLPHHGLQSERFNNALAARNQRMTGIGQPQWVHACDECEKVIPPPDGSPPDTLPSKLVNFSYYMVILLAAVRLRAITMAYVELCEVCYIDKSKSTHLCRAL